MSTLAHFPQITKQLEGLARGQPVTGILPQALQDARRRIAQEFQVELSPQPPRGMCPDLFQLW